ncbi:DUF4350 domain-containing protein [Ningiella sp. W23]|uniref:DUF4350 domain-containing protein n=1 Tax=Ningiella sp. W23 TaxID=3023715 RepID=UPI003757992B
MTQRKNIAVLSLCLMMIGAYIALNLEAYETQTYTPAEAEAYQKPFLAMQRHLDAYNISVEIFDDDSQLFRTAGQAKVPLEAGSIKPAKHDLIVLANAEVSISEAQAEALLTFVKNGGHVIASLQDGRLASGSSSSFSANAFLTRLGFMTAPSNMLSELEATLSSDDLISFVNSERYGELRLALDTDISIEFGDEDYDKLSEMSVRYSGTQFADTLVQLSFGQGHITLVTDIDIWTNFKIDDFDHVFWLHDLSQQAQKIFIFSFRSPPMWYEVIDEYSPMFYTLLLITILLSAWHVGARFGTIKPLKNNFISYFSQHIRAAGEYYWRNQQREEMVEAVRQQLLEELSKRMGTALSADRDADTSAQSKTSGKVETQIKTLCKLSGWERKSVEAYVFEPVKNHDVEFVRIMQGLQQLRKII